MSKAPQVNQLFIDGPAGRLEAVLEVAQEVGQEQPVVGGVVVCHPHPQHGGTLHNKVAHTLARSFVSLGFAALRFNFRGVGQSEGEFDAGAGELDDTLTAIEWLRSRYSQHPVWVAGFSFGAAIAIKAAVATEVDGLVSVAPAVARFATGLNSQPGGPWLVVQGDQDELVDVADTICWLNRLQPGPELQLIQGAEHFFHGRLIDLRESITAFVIAAKA